MDLIGLVDDILACAETIDEGRHGLKTDGEEHKGRLHYEKGIAAALSAFNKALSSNDPKTILAVEEAFVEQELEPILNFAVMMIFIPAAV